MWRRAVLDAFTAQAAGTIPATPTATGALESCCGFVQRAFSTAEVQSSSPMVRAVLDPLTLGMIGRALYRTGEIVFMVSADDGALKLLVAQSHDVRGGPDPEVWTYRVTLTGPSTTWTHDAVPAADVIHVRYAVNAATPWRGFSPLQVASLAGRLSGETTAALADELSGPRGSLLEVPVDGQDQTVARLRRDIPKLGGRLAFVQGGDWNQSTGGVAKWEQRRIGASPPRAWWTWPAPRHGRS